VRAQPPSTHQSTPGIAGEISGPEALKWIYGNYDPMKKRSSSGAEFVQEYATQSGTVKGERQWFLYTTANEESHTCHGCQVKLGAAIFVKQGQWWVVKTDQRGVTEMGSYGVAPPAKVVKWGTASFGLLMEDGWISSGVVTSYQSLLGFDGATFRKIFEVQTFYNEGGSLKPDPDAAWEAPWSFGAPGPDGIFDILVRLKSKGKRAKGYPAAGVYRYDGGVYRNIQTQAGLGKPE
jgi:hypothetical protein